jgi:hypothetical protein
MAFPLLADCLIAESGGRTSALPASDQTRTLIEMQYRDVRLGGAENWSFSRVTQRLSGAALRRTVFPRRLL